MKILSAGADAVFTEVKLPVKSLRLKCDPGAADLLELELAGEINGPMPSFLKLSLEGELYFEGIVDDMILKSGVEGQETELTARDMSSLLTDNQLQPCSLKDPSLRLFQERWLRPLGFTARGNMEAYRGVMTVKEGTSVLRGLMDFCENFMGTQVELRGRLVCCDGNPPARAVPALLPEISRVRTISRYGIPSKIFMKNSLSSSYSAGREAREDMGFPRVFYGEGDFDRKDRLEIRVMGAVMARPGDVYGGELRVSSLRLEFDGEKWISRIEGEVL